MKLGTASQIAIGTDDLESSALVYDRIGFRRISEGNLPSPFIQYTDDSSMILITQNGMNYMGLIYFSVDMPKTVDQLIRNGTVFEQQTHEASGNFFQGIFTTPDGVRINLVNFNPVGMYQPEKKMIYLQDEDFVDSTKFPNPYLGIFGEFSVPVKDLDASLHYWTALGFEILSKNDSPYPWSVITDSLNVIGLHQTTEFKVQAITYFAPDMKKRITALKNNGLEENIKKFGGTGGGDNNAVLTTMEDQHFFLFSF